MFRHEIKKNINMYKNWLNILNNNNLNGKEIIINSLIDEIDNLEIELKLKEEVYNLRNVEIKNLEENK
jgi:hypothetical protein